MLHEPPEDWASELRAHRHSCKTCLLYSNLISYMHYIPLPCVLVTPFNCIAINNCNHRMEISCSRVLRLSGMVICTEMGQYSDEEGELDTSTAKYAKI